MNNKGAQNAFYNAGKETFNSSMARLLAPPLTFIYIYI
ncbi:MAG: hypothetical protein BWY08_00558 [Bacteroidetes bacterium ADurb.Bin174]|nr:MAG: hypothetical protein BWY08_00558 [Bacteroidetes bacterium ADurb.Bin174]